MQIQFCVIWVKKGQLCLNNVKNHYLKKTLFLHGSVQKQDNSNCTAVNTA